MACVRALGMGSMRAGVALRLRCTVLLLVLLLDACGRGRSEEAPASGVQVTYSWEASSWTTCGTGCGGDQADSTRTVTCIELSTSTGGAAAPTVRLVEDALCGGIVPPETRACEALASGSPCDDGIDDTTGDRCHYGVCEGKTVLVGALTFAVLPEDLLLPATGATEEEVAASPAAVALRDAITASLADSLGRAISRWLS